MSAAEPPVIDAHLHIWRTDQPLTDTAWHRPPTEAGIEECVAELDRQGVIFAVVAAASIHGQYFDYVRKALRAHRRLRATAILPHDADLYRMEKMAADGFVGIRLMRAHAKHIPAPDGNLRMHLRRCADLGWHVHLVDQHQRVDASIRTVEESGARLVIDHMGIGDDNYPGGINNEGFKAILAAVERGNTWVKVSGKFRLINTDGTPPEFVEQILRVAGTERVLWGSDWPFAGFEGRVTYDSVLQDYYGLIPDAAVRRRIDETGLRFYFG